MGFQDIGSSQNFFQIIQGDDVNVNFNLRYNRLPVNSEAIDWAKFSSLGINHVAVLTPLGEGVFNLFIDSVDTASFVTGTGHTYDITVKFKDASVGTVTFIRNGKLTVLAKLNGV